MEFDAFGTLWPDHNPEGFARHLTLTHQRQIGGTCVPTGLAVISGEPVATIRRQVNTQSPSNWSDYLAQHGWRLAYCNTDFRRLKHYLPELIAHDDVFVLCTYSSTDPYEIGQEPDEEGWVCGSHFFLLQGDTIYDTRYSQPMPVALYVDRERYVKRIFRLVPSDYQRAI